MTVELFGMARALVGTPEIALDIAEPASCAELAAALGRACPALFGVVVDETGFVEPHHVLLDGRRAPRGEDRFTGADKPCVILLASGG